MGRMGKIYTGKPIKVKSRKELIASLKPHYLQYRRADNGDLPEGYVPQAQTARTESCFDVAGSRLKLRFCVFAELVCARLCAKTCLRQFKHGEEVRT